MDNIYIYNYDYIPLYNIICAYLCYLCYNYICLSIYLYGFCCIRLAFPHIWKGFSDCHRDHLTVIMTLATVGALALQSWEIMSIMFRWMIFALKPFICRGFPLISIDFPIFSHAFLIFLTSFGAESSAGSCASWRSGMPRGTTRRSKGTLCWEGTGKFWGKPLGMEVWIYHICISICLYVHIIYIYI